MPYAKVYHILPQGIFANFKRVFDGNRNCWKLWNKYNNVLKMKSYSCPREWLQRMRQFCFHVNRIVSAILMKKSRANLDLIFFEIISSAGSFFGNIYGNIESLFQNFKCLETTKPIWNNQPIWRGMDGKIIIFNPSNGNCYQLHDTAAEYWQLLMDNKNVEEIVKLLSEEYNETENRIKRDYYEFMDSLKDQNLTSQ